MVAQSCGFMESALSTVLAWLTVLTWLAPPVAPGVLWGPRSSGA
ncbi:Hypothetical protein CAP_1608 [Chondromyces apiculatus DSM 436]|uniref:Uncharacterized protein n=1 Tax=Chondromyces apiculatus DSM 436 TaxID=1192034 RepID=A0A017SSU9_9BACT|nr:Hypothetical protein CAP_1608 [Chondromyces apiculatus DSM 436]